MASPIELNDPTRNEIRPKFLKTCDPPVSNDDKYQIEEENPIFNKRLLNLQIPVNCDDINHMVVSKNWLVCIVSAPTILLRFFLGNTKAPSEIPLEKHISGYTISKIFLDPTGFHLIISLVPKSPGLSADFLYIHGSGPKVRRIEKFKDHEITAVAFNQSFGNESSSGQILLGTSRGLIFETELSVDGDRSTFRKPVYDLGLGLDRPKYPITALEFFRIPDSNKYVVIATTPDCIYIFNEYLKSDEKLSLQGIFNSYMNGTHSFEEVKTDLKYSILRLYSQPNKKYPTHYGWLCGSGIRYGQIELSSSKDEILKGKDLITICSDSEKHVPINERRQNFPKTFMLTEFHAILLYSDHLTAIRLLDQKVVFEEYLQDPFDSLIDIVRDNFTGAIYAYTSKTMFSIKMNDEKRHIWQIYLNKGEYDLAEAFAVENPFQLDIVLAKKAKVAYQQGEYEKSAEIYAETNAPFEKICLKFIDLEEKTSIILYVRKCLAKLPDDDVDQISKLIVWLLQLYLTEVHRPGIKEEQRYKWQGELDSFIDSPRVNNWAEANREVVYKQLSLHADNYNLTKWAAKFGDYELVINQHLYQRKFTEALSVLESQDDPELFYKHCPIIMEKNPEETIAALMRQGKRFDVKKLTPTLICIDSPKHIDEVIKYLEYAIYSLDETEPFLHNYLIKLYAQYKPQKLYRYLENAGNDASIVHYDASYAYRVCLKHDAKTACVFLQCLLEMWDAAVELALTFNIQLAKETAKKPSDEEVRRELWLKIAQHEIQKTNDVKRALELLKECPLLRIEDLLPFFSDFEKIDDFKEAICISLKEYNQNMQDIQREMEESYNAAERVRADLKTIRERSIRVGAQDPCAICESYLLVKPFFIFPCGHKFHSDCLEKQIIPMLSSDQSRKLTSLKHQLENVVTESITIGERPNVQQRQTRDKIKTEIENIIASDCLFCGLMIDSIDQPFVTDWEQENVDWE